MLSTFRPFHRRKTRKRTESKFNGQQVQLLEDRTLLAAFVWTGLGEDSNWSNSLNWAIESGDDAGTIGIPDAGIDDAYLRSVASIMLDQNIDLANLVSSTGVSIDSESNTLSTNRIEVQGNSLSFHNGGLLQADTVDLGTGAFHAGLNLRDVGTTLLASVVNVGGQTSARLLFSQESVGSIDNLNVGSQAGNPGEVEITLGASVTANTAIVGTEFGHGKLRIHDIDSNLLVTGGLLVGALESTGGIGVTNAGLFETVDVVVGSSGLLNSFGDDSRVLVHGDLQIDPGSDAASGAVSVGTGSSMKVDGDVQVNGRLTARHALTITGKTEIGAESGTATVTFESTELVTTGEMNVIDGLLTVSDSIARVAHLTIEPDAETRVTSSFSELSAIQAGKTDIYGTLRVIGDSATLISNDIHVYGGGLAELDAGPAPPGEPQGQLVVDKGGVVDVGSASELTMAFIQNHGLIRLTEGSTWRSITIDSDGDIEITGSVWDNATLTTITDGTMHVHDSGTLDSLVITVGDGGILRGDSDSANNAIINGGIAVLPGGEVIGNHQVFTLPPVTIGGKWKPGNSPGENIINGHVSFERGELQMEIGGIARGDEYDYLEVTGNAYFSTGQLSISLIDDHAPVAGTEYRLISADTVEGEFDGLSEGYHDGGGALPWLSDGLRWHVSYERGLVLSVATAPPVVSISATVDSTDEFGGTPGLFTLTREGNTDLNLTVYLDVGGTAGESLDYQYIRKDVTFNPGEETTTILVEGFPDFEEEPTETVVVGLVPDDSYLVNEDASSATVKILDSGSGMPPIDGMDDEGDDDEGEGTTDVMPPPTSPPVLLVVPSSEARTAQRPAPPEPAIEFPTVIAEFAPAMNQLLLFDFLDDAL